VILGYTAAALIATGVVIPVLPAASLTNFGGYVAWCVWLLAVAVILYRVNDTSRVACPKSAEGVPAHTRASPAQNPFAEVANLRVARPASHDVAGVLLLSPPALLEATIALVGSPLLVRGPGQSTSGKRPGNWPVGPVGGWAGTRASTWLDRRRCVNRAADSAAPHTFGGSGARWASASAWAERDVAVHGRRAISRSERAMSLEPNARAVGRRL